MWPSSHPRGGQLNEDYSNTASSITQTWHQNGSRSCPENTIPIRRTMEEDVRRADSPRSYGKKERRPKFTPVDGAGQPTTVTSGHQVHGCIDILFH